MTYSQALREAKKRWGKDVRIERIVLNRKNSRQTKRAAPIGVEYRVGPIAVGPVLGSVFVVKGIGRNWEEAFVYADRQKPLK